MKRGAAIFTALAVLAAAPATAQTEMAAPTAVARLAALANGLCVDVLSGRVTVPTDVSGDDSFNAGYGLSTGVPGNVMDAFGPNIGMLSGARLASGVTTEGPFVVAMGGRAGETCRLIVMSGSQGQSIGQEVHRAMQSADMGWRDLPMASQSTAATKLSLLKRDHRGNPMLANILTPNQAGPVAMAMVVAAIPPNVTLPEGY